MNKHMGNFSRETETVRKSQIEMLKKIHTIREEEIFHGSYQ